MFEKTLNRGYLMFEKFLKILLIFLVLLLIYKCTIGNPFFAIRVNWGIKLPSTYKIVYNSNTEPSFLGDGTKYTILKYNSNRKIKELNNINWKKEKNIILENETFEILSVLEINKKYHLNFNNGYWYYEQVKRDYSKLILLYFPKSRMLYIIEQLR